MEYFFTLYFGENMKKISITTEYITLGQFLKLANLISTGGEAKIFLLSNVLILINGEEDRRRGRKLRHGDIIQVEKEKFIID